METNASNARFTGKSKDFCANSNDGIVSNNSSFNVMLFLFNVLLIDLNQRKSSNSPIPSFLSISNVYISAGTMSIECKTGSMAGNPESTL